MSNLQYVLDRIEEGAKVRLAIDYFGQHLVVVPRRWLPGTRKIKLDQEDVAAVERALRGRRGQSRRLPQPATAVRS